MKFMRIRSLISLLLLYLLFGIVSLRAGNYSISIVSETPVADTLRTSFPGTVREIKQHTDIEIHFKLDNSELDLNYMGNGHSLRRFAAFIDSVGITHIDSVVIISQSSPEGPHSRNLRLSEGRARAMREYLLSHHPELSGRLYVSPDGESWSRLREYVNNDTIIKEEEKAKVLSIIDSRSPLETKKWRLKQHPGYKYLYKTYYPLLRNSNFRIQYFTLSDTTPTLVAAPVAAPDTVVPTPVPVDTVTSSPEPAIDTWPPRLHIKSNTIGLLMGVANLAIEADLCPHLSLTLPINYCAWNYFIETVKFRTFSLQPEVRYWLNENNSGLFAGLHFGWGYYNFAFDGKYRYQDRSAKTPAIGGGLSLGYRTPISHNKRWSLEFSLGCGIYDLHYDKFHNTPSTKDGLLVESKKENYIGLDQAAVSLTYSFDLKKKGGKR